MEILNFISEKPLEFTTITLSTGAILISVSSIITNISSQKQFREYFSDLRKIKRMNESINQQGQQIIDSRFNLEKLQQQISDLSKEIESNKQRNKKLLKNIQQLNEKIKSINFLANSDTESRSKVIDDNDKETPANHYDIDLIFVKYNLLDTQYFKEGNFIAAKLTDDSENNKRAIDGIPIVEFEYTENAVGSPYLIFESQGNYYLIPNAINPKILRLIKLNNDSRVFEMKALSDDFELSSAAVVELMANNKWKLISKGEFRDRSI